MLNRAVGEKRKPRPKSWVEQTLLLKLLPGYLVDMTLSGLNTGRLDQEIFSLRWEWEYRVTGLDVIVFVLPEGGNQKRSSTHRSIELSGQVHKIVCFAMPTLRVGLDTNVLLSGIAYPSSIPGKIMSSWRHVAIEVLLLDFILDESPEWTNKRMTSSIS